MKTIPEIIAENPIGTEFETESVLPEAKASTKIMLGKKFRCVSLTIIIECEDGDLLTLKSTTPDFDQDVLDNEDDDEEED